MLLLGAVESCLEVDYFHRDLQSALHYVAPESAGVVVDLGFHPAAEVLHSLGEGGIVVVVTAGVFHRYLDVELLQMVDFEEQDRLHTTEGN